MVRFQPVAYVRESGGLDCRLRQRQPGETGRLAVLVREGSAGSLHSRVRIPGPPYRFGAGELRVPMQYERAGPGGPGEGKCESRERPAHGSARARG